MTLSVIVQEAWENSPRVRAQRKHLGGTWPSRGCVDTVGGKTNHKTGLCPTKQVLLSLQCLKNSHFKRVCVLGRRVDYDASSSIRVVELQVFATDPGRQFVHG